MKKLIVLCLILFLGGCGVPAGEAGADGTSGLDGGDGRDYVTPILRPYSWDTTGTVADFQDCVLSIPQLSQVAFSQTNNNNYVMINVPAGNAGKVLKVVINGNQSPAVTVPDDSANSLVVYTVAGSDYLWGKYLGVERMTTENRYHYIAWYVDNVQQEFYYCNSFE